MYIIISEFCTFINIFLTNPEILKAITDQQKTTEFH